MIYFWSIVFTTFLVEDWAIAGSLVLVAQGEMSLALAFLACFVGISVGDVLLFYLGRLAGRYPRVAAWPLVQRAHQYFSDPLNRGKMTSAIIISRAIPGTRFPTYVSAGLIGYSAWRFLVLTPLSVAAWVAIAFWGGLSLQGLIREHWLLGLILFLGILTILRKAIPLLLHRWRRKALRHWWRRWFIFEFWPAWFAYAPVVPYYVYLSLRHGSLIHPFFANPSLPNSGLIGEEKWDIQKYLNPDDSATLKTIRVPAGSTALEVKALAQDAAISFPFVLKPNVGQRGFAVRFIKDETALEEYVQLAQFEYLIQEKSRFEREAGVFYIRHPHSSQGILYSITDKEFPFVMGNGKSALGELILNDSRARIISGQYFDRFERRLDEIISQGEKVILSECGNHSQGAIFIDGQYMRTEALRLRIEELANHIPRFHFGRFDIRYNSVSDLMKGLNFEIVEVNGAGADVTHIYDERTKVSEAYRVMLAQWRMLFQIGKESRALYECEALVDIRAFLKEIARVNLRRDRLSVSS